MIIFPAIDLRHGQVVRLKQGQAERMTVFGNDPLSTARAWVDKGAEWLHVVNLDGAIGDGDSPSSSALSHPIDINLQILESICADLPDTSVQFGGGIRSIADLQSVFNCGVSRAVLGTVALTNPKLVRLTIGRFGSHRLVIGLDASKGTIATHGWTQSSSVSPIELGLSMREIGVRYALYTNVQRDGMMSGVDVVGTAQLARATGLRVIASGGFSTLADLEQLLSEDDAGIEGVVIGQALYTGAVPLESALQMAHAQPSGPCLEE